MVQRSSAQPASAKRWFEIQVRDQRGPSAKLIVKSKRQHDIPGRLALRIDEPRAAKGILAEQQLETYPNLRAVERYVVKAIIFFDQPQ